MLKTIRFFILGMTLIGLTFGNPLAFAKEHPGQVPAGWSKGKKTGWKGQGHPPGLAKKHKMKAVKAKAKKQAKKTEVQKEELEKSALNETETLKETGSASETGEAGVSEQKTNE